MHWVSEREFCIIIMYIIIHIYKQFCIASSTLHLSTAHYQPNTFQQYQKACRACQIQQRCELPVSIPSTANREVAVLVPGNPDISRLFFLFPAIYI